MRELTSAVTHAQLPVVITALPGRVSGEGATLYMTHAQLPVVIVAISVIRLTYSTE